MIAAFTKVDEIAIAEAKVVPESGIQVVSSLEGGILSELNLKEGQIVEEGQVLLKFDPKRFESQYRELEAKRIALRIITTRLRAESQGTELTYPQSLQRLAPGAIRDEISLYQTRQSAFKESIELLGKSLKLL